MMAIHERTGVQCGVAAPGFLSPAAFLGMAAVLFSFGCGNGGGDGADSGTDGAPDSDPDGFEDSAADPDGLEAGDADGVPDWIDALEDSDAAGDDVTPDSLPDIIDVEEDWGAGPIDDRARPGPHPRELPFAYTRPEEGTPLTSEELASFTQRYLELLEHTDYFDFLDGRVHGIPESDPDGRYWYGTWWSGVHVYREGGRVRFWHNPAGADNNGLRTAQVLEGACYGYALWGDADLEHLAQKLIRGFNSWVMSMHSTSHAWDGVLMTRASYPQSVTATERGLEVFIDYSENHPGEDNGATQYVHIPDNPHWGDMWVKNKRSKDDIGHMFRAVAQVDTCNGLFADPATYDALDDLWGFYFSWARRVEDDGWRIATYDKDLELWWPNEDLARYFTVGGAECTGTLALRLAGRYHPGDIDCGDGIGPGDWYMAENHNSNANILRSHHEAAVNHALLANKPDIAYNLLQGMTQRITRFIGGFEEGSQPDVYGADDFNALIMHSANMGVPLTWREVRWLQGQFDEARGEFMGIATHHYDIFASGVPDGEYSYGPGSAPVRINDVGLLLGTCASQWRNPASKPVLDCDLVRAWTP
ncbi:MAG: hypothetical protein ABIJ56_20180 [Pseudomonadota bacterium]